MEPTAKNPLSDLRGRPAPPADSVEPARGPSAVADLGPVLLNSGGDLNPHSGDRAHQQLPGPAFHVVAWAQGLGQGAANPRSTRCGRRTSVRPSLADRRHQRRPVPVLLQGNYIRCSGPEQTGRQLLAGGCLGVALAHPGSSLEGPQIWNTLDPRASRAPRPTHSSPSMLEAVSAQHYQDGSGAHTTSVDSSPRTATPVLMVLT